MEPCGALSSPVDSFALLADLRFPVRLVKDSLNEMYRDGRSEVGGSLDLGSPPRATIRICIYIYIYREREREREIYISAPMRG